MMPRSLRALLPTTAALALAACGGELDLQLTLVVRPCDADPGIDPLADVQLLRFTVYGEGIDSFNYQTRAVVNQRSVEIPKIPAGPDRNVVVEALGPGEVLVARGETGPLDLAQPARRLEAAVFLRVADGFTPTADGAAPTTCTTMGSARAGHTATLLGDGRVLIAGGFLRNQAGERVALRSTELYDPRTGRFEPGPELNQRRAFHTATHLPRSNLVVFAGGEMTPVPGQGAALVSAELYEEDTGVVRFLQMRVPRTRHAAAVPPDRGRLLLVGGQTPEHVSIASTEEFDPVRREFRLAPPLPGARFEPGAVGLSGGRVLVAGGFDGAAAQATVHLFVARDDGSYDLRAADQFNVRLANARYAPMMTVLDADRVLVAGGFSTRPPFALQGASRFAEVVNAASAQATPAEPLAVNRGHGGAVSLLDGTALVAGGAFASGTEPLVHTSADVYAPSTSGNGGVAMRRANRAMIAGRYHAAWTVLQDGTVLVTGGLDENGLARDSAEVFQPSYRASLQSPYR
jgi:hypothetical protein